MNRTKTRFLKGIARHLVHTTKLPSNSIKRAKGPSSYGFYHGHIHRRQYSIRDRYVFPVREEEELAAAQSEEKKLQEQAFSVHKRHKKHLKEAASTSQWNRIAEPGFDVKYATLDRPVVPEGAKSLSMAIIGPANSGKSTWINRMCGGRISSVSRKPQTTQNLVTGILTIDKTQLIIVDTPGLVPKEFVRKYNRRIATGAWNALDSADVVLVMVDCFKVIDQVLLELIQKLDEYMQNRSKDPSLSPIRTILFLNKYDRYETYKSRNDKMYPVVDRFRKHIPSLDRIFEKIYYGSSLTGLNLNKLRDKLVEMAPLRDWEYAKGVVTNQSRLEIVQEVIKEKIFRHLNQELPYSIRQESVSWVEDPVRGIIKIDQKIYVRKQSQMFLNTFSLTGTHTKKIVIGKHGNVIHSIRHEAARDLETLLGSLVVLNLRVSVRNEDVEPDLAEMRSQANNAERDYAWDDADLSEEEIFCGLNSPLAPYKKWAHDELSNEHRDSAVESQERDLPKATDQPKECNRTQRREKSCELTSCQRRDAEEKEALTQSLTILTQLEEGGETKKIPGPAGWLPPISSSTLSDLKGKVVLQKDEVKNRSVNFLSGEPFLARSQTSGSRNAIEDQADFRQPAWANMLIDLNLPPFVRAEKSHELLSYHLKWVHTVGYWEKIPILVVLIKMVRMIGDCARVVLKDPTGEYDWNTVHKSVFESYPDLMQGCVVQLKDVSVVSPEKNAHYLVILPENVARVWSKTAKIAPKQLSRLSRNLYQYSSIYKDGAQIRQCIESQLTSFDNQSKPSRQKEAAHQFQHREEKKKIRNCASDNANISSSNKDIDIDAIKVNKDDMKFNGNMKSSINTKKEMKFGHTNNNNMAFGLRGGISGSVNNKNQADCTVGKVNGVDADFNDMNVAKVSADDANSSHNIVTAIDTTKHSFWHVASGLTANDSDVAPPQEDMKNNRNMDADNKNSIVKYSTSQGVCIDKNSQTLREGLKYERDRWYDQMTKVDRGWMGGLQIIAGQCKSDASIVASSRHFLDDEVEPNGRTRKSAMLDEEAIIESILHDIENHGDTQSRRTDSIMTENPPNGKNEGNTNNKQAVKTDDDGNIIHNGTCKKGASDYINIMTNATDYECITNKREGKLNKNDSVIQANLQNIAYNKHLEKDLSNPDQVRPLSSPLKSKNSSDLFTPVTFTSATNSANGSFCAIPEKTERVNEFRQKSTADHAKKFERECKQTFSQTINISSDPSSEAIKHHQEQIKSSRWIIKKKTSNSRELPKKIELTPNSSDLPSLFQSAMSHSTSALNGTISNFHRRLTDNR